MDQSRFPGFYKLSVPERVNLVRERGLLSREDFQTLSTGAHTLSVARADKMIENVVGVMGLPLGLGLNFLINGKDPSGFCDTDTCLRFFRALVKAASK